MRIHHRLSALPDNLFVKIINSGIDADKDEIIEFYEDEQEKWNKVRPILSKDNRGIDLITTYFSHAELMDSEFMFITSFFAQYYPLPYSSLPSERPIPEFFTQVYDGKGCRGCFTGLKQVRPFRLKKEPNWRGNKHFFKLNWIEDELFVKKETWETHLKPLGIKANPVFKGTRGENELKTVVQLVIDTISDYPIDMESYEHLADLPYEICERCGYKRYEWIKKGRFPPLLGSTNALIFKTQEYFGSGGSSMQEIIITPSLYKVLYDNDLTKQLHFSVLG